MRRKFQYLLYGIFLVEWYQRCSVCIKMEHRLWRNTAPFVPQYYTVCGTTPQRFFDEDEQKDSKTFGGLEGKGIYL